MVCVPEAVDFVVLSGARIALGGLTEEDALELGFYVFFQFRYLYEQVRGYDKRRLDAYPKLIQNRFSG